jgi:hypothetical protein
VIEGSDRDAPDAGLEEPILELHEGDTEEIDAIAVPVDDGVSIAPVDMVPVPASRRSGALASLRSAPAVQAAAVAAGGFVAGAAVVGIARRRRGGAVRVARRGSDSARGRRAKGARQGAGELLQIVGSRSLLVDVHLLDSAARGRR